MSRLSALLALALAAALSLPSLTYASGAPASAPDAGPTAEVGAPHFPLGLGGPVTARAAIEAAVGAEVAATDTVDVARYATLAEAVAAIQTADVKIESPDVSESFLYGWSVSLSGDRALVGDPEVDTGGLFTFTGAAYVYAFDASQPVGQQWSLEGRLAADDGEADDNFGVSVSLDGDRAFIGASGDDPGGSVYVFAFDGSQPPGQQWIQEARLVGPSGGGSFGFSVSLSGERALVGEPFVDTGSAYVFAFDGASWSQEAKLVASDASDGDRFGFSVSLSGERALVGEPYVFPNDGMIDTGSAYVFAFDGASWSQEAKLVASDASDGDRFGESVSLSGERVLVGAPRDDADDGTIDVGSAYVFAFDGSQPSGQQWSQESKLTIEPMAVGPDVYENFGASVALLGDLALVGSPYQWPTSADSVPPGKAFLFRNDGATWGLQNVFEASDASSIDRFGKSVALSADRALVGAPGSVGFVKDPDAVYTFELENGAPLVADAGPDQTVVAGQTVTLDGTGSVGAETFAWTLDGAALADANTATPTFCAAVPGAYDATLLVGNAVGFTSDTVTVTALSPSEALDALVGDMVATAGLSRAQARALIAELKKAQRALDRGLSPAPFLAAFRSQVLGLEADGTLTAAAADALVTSVDAVAEAVASPCSETAGAQALASSTAAGFGLSAWPNPTAGQATVAFSVEAATDARLAVYDALGREVAVLVEGAVEAGRHQVALGAGALPAGVYLVRLATADGQAATARLTRLR